MPLIIYVTLLFIRGFCIWCVCVCVVFSSESIVHACVRSLQIIIYSGRQTITMVMQTFSEM